MPDTQTTSPNGIVKQDGGHAEGDDRAGTVRRITLWGLFLNLLLAAGKFIFGIVGSSQALVADGVHSLSDSATDVAVLIGAPYWLAPPDSRHPYGHGRIETLITFLIGALLGIVGIALGLRAIATLKKPDIAGPTMAVFATACISIVTKEVMYKWTVRIGKRIKSAAVVANAWHHRSDGLSSLPVAAAVVGMRLHPDWMYLDHIAAMLVSLLIVQAAWKILWPALKQLVDTGASREEIARLSVLVAETKGVKEVHGMRSRNVGPGLQLDLHVLVDPGLTVKEGHDIADLVTERLLNEDPDVVDVLVHIEPHDTESTG